MIQSKLKQNTLPHFSKNYSISFYVVFIWISLICTVLSYISRDYKAEKLFYKKGFYIYLYKFNFI